MRMQMAFPWLRAKAALPPAAAMTFLVSLAIWGHVCHWKFHSGEHEPAGSAARGASPTVAGEHAPASSDLVDSAADKRADDALAHPSPMRIDFPSTEAVRKSGIETARAEERSIDQEIIANGVITYDQTRVAQLSARVPGTVWRIEKQLGQPIRKGDVLAVIEAVDVGKAKGDLLQAVVDYQLKTGIAERLEAKQSFIPERQLYEVQADARAAYIRMVNAQQMLVNYGLPTRLEDLRNLTDNELAKRVQFLGLPESIVATLDPASTTVSLVPLVAPFDGVVIGRDIAQGEVVSPSAAQFEVADISRMWIRMDVRREDAGRLKLGQQVIFTIDGSANQIVSTISWISSEIDEKTRTVPVRAEVANPLVPQEAEQGQERRLLLANAFGTGRICVAEVPRAVIVPHDAVQWEGHRWIAFVRVDATSFEARPVEPGITLRDRVEIRTGLVPGDTVATTGNHLLKSEIIRSRLAARQ